MARPRHWTMATLSERAWRKLTRTKWLNVYHFLFSVKVLYEVYQDALLTWEMFPHQSFAKSVVEEIWLHETWLFLWDRPIKTITLWWIQLLMICSYHYQWLERLWLSVNQCLCWQYLSEVFHEHIAPWIPFGEAMDVPDLISDTEQEPHEMSLDSEEEFGFADEEDVDSDPSTTHARTKAAFEALMKAKAAHAHKIIRRPDDWLVYDPIRGLVFQRDATAMSIDHEEQEDQDDVPEKHTSARTNQIDESSNDADQEVDKDEGEDEDKDEGEDEDKADQEQEDSQQQQQQQPRDTRTPYFLRRRKNDRKESQDNTSAPVLTNGTRLS